MSLLRNAICFWQPWVGQHSRSNKSVRRRNGRTILAGEALEPRAMCAVDTNDQIAEAVSLGAMTANLVRTGETIAVSTDVDMFKFSVTAGQRIGFDIDRPRGRLDSFLRLFNSSGIQLAFNDDGPNALEANSTESYFEYTFTAAGTYCVGVSGFGNQNYGAVSGNGDTNGSVGSYSLLLTRLTVAPPPPADTDLDDQLIQAISLGAMTQTRTRTNESIGAATDGDMFRFTVTAGQRIAFDVDRPSGSLNSFLRVFDARGNQIAANDDGPTPGESNSTESYVEVTFSAGGTFYVGVSGYGNQNYSAVTGNGDTNGSTGVYSLSLSVVQVAPPPPPAQSGFQITLAMSGMSASQQNIFNQAASRWSQIIVGDLPDVLVNGQVIDDVRISASATPIDGVNGILGQAGPDNLRSGSLLPFMGTMQFDTADLNSMESQGTLMGVILHEMGHALGIGTIWSDRGLLSGGGGADPRFIGAQATAAYNQIFGRNESGVPVANVGGAGSRDSHWRESVFGNELMSPTIAGNLNPLSRVTVASLADLGYIVNLNAADPFTPPSAVGSGSSTGGSSNLAGLFAADDSFHDSHLDHYDQTAGDLDHVDLSRPTPVVGGGIVLPPLSNREVTVLAALARVNPRAAEALASHLAAVDHLMESLVNNLTCPFA